MAGHGGRRDGRRARARLRRRHAPSSVAGATRLGQQRRDGVVFAWGNNRDGQLGLGVLAAGGYVRSPRIVDVLNGANAVAIAAGYFHTVALLADGSVRTFGASKLAGPQNFHAASA